MSSLTPYFIYVFKALFSVFQRYFSKYFYNTEALAASYPTSIQIRPSIPNTQPSIWRYSSGNVMTLHTCIHIYMQLLQWITTWDCATMATIYGCSHLHLGRCSDYTSKIFCTRQQILWLYIQNILLLSRCFDYTSQIYCTSTHKKYI